MKRNIKYLAGFLMIFSLVSGMSCKSKETVNKTEVKKDTPKVEIERGKAMSSIEGKDGLFAILTTEKGEIALELFYKETPMTVSNFVGLAEGTLDAAKGKPFYDGLKFHRVISDFMIQGGDPKGNGTGGPGYKFPDEFVDGLIFDKPGKLAMANSGPATNGSQFFITHVSTDWLNYKHTIFGEVVYGQDVVNKVAQGDSIISLQIVRNGSDAQAFKVTQESFNALIEAQKKAEEDKKAKAMEDVIAGCTKTSEGIYFKVLEEGSGKAVGSGTNVSVEYKGYLIDGSIFDASKYFHPQGHEALDFTTGAGQMIPGFDMMVQEMKLNEVRKIVLPPELGYGEYGYPGVIPGNAYICFDIKVVKF